MIHFHKSKEWTILWFRLLYWTLNESDMKRSEWIRLLHLKNGGKWTTLEFQFCFIHIFISRHWVKQTLNVDFTSTLLLHCRSCPVCVSVFVLSVCIAIFLCSVTMPLRVESLSSYVHVSLYVLFTVYCCNVLWCKFIIALSQCKDGWTDLRKNSCYNSGANRDPTWTNTQTNKQMVPPGPVTNLNEWENVIIF